MAFKKLLEDDEALRSLLQNFLPLPEGSLVEEVTREETEEKPEDITEPVGRTFILDLKVRIHRSKEGALLEPEMVNVEIQTSRDYHFTDRLVAYASLPYVFGTTHERGGLREIAPDIFAGIQHRQPRHPEGEKRSTTTRPGYDSTIPPMSISAAPPDIYWSNWISFTGR